MAKTKVHQAIMECSVCGERNYHTKRNVNNIKERLVLKKHCPKCRKHTEHAETK